MKISEQLKKLCEEATTSQDPRKVDELVRLCMHDARTIASIMSDLNPIPYTPSDNYSNEKFSKSATQSLEVLEELKTKLKSLSDTVKKMSKEAAKLSKLREKVVGWWVVLPDTGDVYKAEYRNRSIFAGGDLWQFGKLGGTLVAEMGDGSYQIRNTFKFDFEDYASEAIIELINYKKNSV